MSQGPLAPVRVVLQRSFADWLIVAATWLVILCATMLVAIGMMYGDAVAKTGLDRILDDQPGTATSVVVTMRASRDELIDAEPAVDAQMSRFMRWTDGELVSILRSDTWRLPAAPEDELTPLAEFASFDGFDRHATLIDGEWPVEGAAEPMQVALSRATAEALGVGTGDTIELTAQRESAGTLSVVVTGTWEAADATDPYWDPESLDLLGRTEGSSFATYGPFVVTRQDLLGRALTRDASLEVRGIPNFANLQVDEVDRMRADVAALESRLSNALGERAFFQVGTSLDTILESAGRSLLVSRSGVVVLTIQFAVLAGYALLLVAGLLVEQRRVETALLRSRGAGVPHIALMSFIEALILVVPAVIAAPWLAMGVLNLLNVSGPLADAGVRISPRIDGTVLAAAAGAGLACVVGLVLPALGAGRGLAAVRQTISRQGNRTLAQRLGLDLALVVLAGIGLWQLRQYGAPLTQTVRGSVGLDPLLVAAPAIGLLAGSILALRIVPLAAELAERALTGRRGLVAPLGARQLSRRPLRYTRSALLLMLAAALGTFAGAYASTWTRSQADQAAYRTAADVRVEVSGFPQLPEWAIGSAYRSVDGVDVAVPVARAGFDVADGSGELLAVDTRTATEAIAFRPDLATEPIADLLGSLRSDAEVPAINVPGTPVRLAVDLDVVIEPVPPQVLEDGTVIESAPLSPGFRGIVPAIIVRDADGLLQRLTGGRATVGGGDQRVETSLAVDEGGATPAYPLEVLAVEVTVQLADGVTARGTLDLRGVEVADDPGGPWTSLPLDGMAWTRASQDGGAGGTGGTGQRPIGSFGDLLEFEGTDVLLGGAASAVVRLSSAGADSLPIPALANPELLRTMGIDVGATVNLGSLSSRRDFTIVGAIEGFPTLDPSAPFLVADIGAVSAADAAGGRQLEASEWWLDVAPGSGGPVVEALGEPRYSTDSVTSVDELRRDLLSDPIALGVIGALALGALAAVIFAAIGFIVSATVSTRERLGEFALLQAIGLSHRQLSGWLTLENSFLLATGLLVGTGLGLVLAWVVLPFVTLTQEATLAVPPVEVVIPWGIYGLLYLVALVALVLTVVVIGQLLGRVRVSGVLRSGGE